MRNGQMTEKNQRHFIEPLSIQLPMRVKSTPYTSKYKKKIFSVEEHCILHCLHERSAGKKESYAQKTFNANVDIEGGQAAGCRRLAAFRLFW
jgi:hypothetical protein